MCCTSRRIDELGSGVKIPKRFGLGSPHSGCVCELLGDVGGFTSEGQRPKGWDTRAIVFVVCL